MQQTTHDSKDARWQRAKYNPDIHYIGSVCRREHWDESLSGTLRYRRNHDCVRCHHEREKAAKRKGDSQAQARRWAEKRKLESRYT